MKTLLLCTGLCLFLSFNVQGQVTQQQIDTHIVLAQDHMRQENFTEARKALHWLLTNAPDYNKSIYIMAYKAYEKVAQNEQSPAQKLVYLDSMLTVYQLKETRFGLTDLERNNLAYRYYKYYRKDTDKLETAMTNFEIVFSKPETVIRNKLPAFIATIRLYHTKVRPIGVEQLLAYRASIAKAEAARRAAGVDPEKIQKLTDVIDNIFYQTIEGSLSCPVIQKVATAEKLSEPQFAKMVLAWSIDFNCTSFDFFEASLLTLVKHPETRNPGILNILAQRAAAAGDYTASIDWYQQSAAEQDNPVKKANTYMDMAKVYLLQKNKSKARELAYKAAETDEKRLAGSLSFVANLYMSSFDDCSQGYSQVDDRAVFMAAYDLFEKAGDINGMQAAREQFPSPSQVHMDNYMEGDVIDIGCWINLKTKVRIRRSQ